jgi:hypothetical protein
VQKLQTIVDDSLVEENTPATQEIPAMADNLDASLGVVAVQLVENLVMRKNIALLKGDALGCPGALNRVIVLGLRDRNRVVNKVTDCLDLDPQEFLLLSSRGKELLLLLLEIGYGISAP